MRTSTLSSMAVAKVRRRSAFRDPGLALSLLQDMVHRLVGQPVVPGRGAGTHRNAGDLTDSLFFKFRGKTWCAHRLLLCSNYRTDLSTGSGALHFAHHLVYFSVFTSLNLNTQCYKSDATTVVYRLSVVYERPSGYGSVPPGEKRNWHVRPCMISSALCSVKRRIRSL